MSLITRVTPRPAAAPAPLPSKSATLERELAAKQAALAAIPARRDAAKRAGDAAVVVRLDPEEADLRAAIATLEGEIAAARKAEADAAAAAHRQALLVREAELRAAVAAKYAETRPHLQALATICREGAVLRQHLAAVESHLTGRAFDSCIAGLALDEREFLLAALEHLARWAWDSARAVQVNFPPGVPQREAQDVIFAARFGA